MKTRDETDREGESARVLLVQYSSNRDGSAFSGLLIADGLAEAGCKVHVAFGFDGPMVARYRAAGHTVHVVPHKNWLRRGRTHQFAKDVWREWQRAGAFEALIEKVNPRLVYLNTVVSLAGAVAAQRAGVPCIWHLREMFADIGGEMQAPRWARPWVRGALRRYASRLVANSKATAQNLLGDDALIDVEVVPNAIGARFFCDDRTQASARETLDLPPETTIIGVSGTLRPVKGHPFFFEAVAPLLRAHPDWLVAVTGGGAAAYVRQVKAQVEALDIAAQVRFMDWVDDMPAFYRACDLVCIPSRAESFGRTVIEAFASRTPVVATAVGGIREIVDGRITGRLVVYGDVEALRAAITGLLDDANLRQKMSAQARQVAEHTYHECVYKKRIAELVAGASSNYSI